ncbi:MAG: hypothetical protein PHS53_04815 [Candidatus Pacebacteria bacterium]|nr:hypothetical protein [Candidatus Paceibacterota bacterium]
MKIIQVIPIGRGISKEVLSYFTALPAEAGALVEISVRAKKMPGLVIEAQNIGIMKSEIKSLPFGMRKVERILSSSFFTERYLRSVKVCAEYYATTMGSILSVLIPKVLLENIGEIEKLAQKGESTKNQGDIRPSVIQASREERQLQYRSIIREEFAKSRSVYCCLPTIEEAKTYFKNLSRGIEMHSFFVSGSLSKKEFLKVWKEATETSHPILIVGTGACLSLRRFDIGAIIIDEESSGTFKTLRRPYLDIRAFAEIYAKMLGAQFVLGDTLLRIETLWKKEKGEYTAIQPIQWKSGKDERTLLVNLKSEESKGDKKFHTVGDAVNEMIQNAKAHKKHIFLFATKKGYAPSIICRDCRNFALCLTCHAPIAFYKDKDEKTNFFLCHRCKRSRPADELCLACGSWRLDPSGIGIDLVREELAEKIPEELIFVIDKDKAKTSVQVKKILSRFLHSEWGVLLGTEVVFSAMEDKLDGVAILSLDSLFALPNFRINEKIMHLVSKMRSLTDGQCIIQTRNPDEKILKYAQEGNILDFYQSEISEREQFNYPPFSVLIEISLSGGRGEVEAEMKKMKEIYFKGYELEVFPAFIPEARGTYTLKGILKIPESEWPKEDLTKKLSALPPYFSVKINPESIL